KLVSGPHAWPFVTYLVSCCLYPLASSCAHMFSTMSGRTRHLCYFLDYAALGTYSLGEGSARVPGFLEPARPRLSKAARTLAFAYPYVFDSIPLFYRVRSRRGAGKTLGKTHPHGHSHQLFHVCGVLGTHFQMEAIRVDMAQRHGGIPANSALQSLVPMGIGAAAALGIVALCSASPSPKPREKPH
ncbi:PREDICTED: membrane progestin receptor gamma, partial [Tinamus guttatus]|uniref:membrane progestin receptor gamma n=1 Tax=Tinamus guttatus TaxID=94827 RepID=UPI00052EC94E